MKQGGIIIISGPSGSGKTTLHDKILEDPKFKRHIVKSISATTRGMRPGEKNGKDYLFLSHKMFKYKIRAGHFLEWEQVFDNYYGTPNKNVVDIIKKGKYVLLCIDVEGAKTVIKKFPKAITIFVKTSNIEQLKKRLTSRASDSKDSITLRLNRARKELKEAKNYQDVIVNDTLSKAVKQLKSVLTEKMAF